MTPARTGTTFDAACVLVETALAARREILAGLVKSGDPRNALHPLRESMRSHVWRAGGREIALEGIVRRYDRHTRAEGFHVLHDWDGKADRVNADMIPVDVLGYVLDTRAGDRGLGGAASILLDYYLLYLLALLSLKLWDEGDPDANLDRLGALLADLQGPGGSGQQFAADPATLILIATSHYELEERGYHALLEKVRSLRSAHRLQAALSHAPSLACHLRFGFEATYRRDTIVMRNDNVADYPWLSFALATLMREYCRLRETGAGAPERAAVVEALLSGLTPDARAFVGRQPPASLSGHDREVSEFRDRFHEYRADLLTEFERYRPSGETVYSPLCLFFNFSHNVLKGAVVDALLADRPWHLSLNDLLTARCGGERTGEAKAALAATLMRYARQSPDTINGRPTPAIVYDLRTGRRAFEVTLQKLRM